MTFAWPFLLWLLLLPVAWFFWDLLRTRGRGATHAHPKIILAEAGQRHVSLAARRPAAGRARPWFSLGLLLAIVALARPQWGRIDEPVFEQAREILIAMDLSRSMLTPDVKPSRLERAKLLTQALLEKLAGERVGLVVFSGTAFLQSPLSSDYEILREFLPALGPDFLPEGGTNYRALIDTALAAFGSTAAADRFLIVLSDGEATEENWRERVAALKTKGVRVIALGVGTSTGAMIPDGAGGLVKDERGAVVLSKLESDTLRQLANQTSGVYQDASTWIDLAAVIQATVDAGQKGKFTDQNTVRLVERFQWPLALALWCLLVSAYYELPVRPKPREVKLRGPEATPAGPVPPARQTVASLILAGLLLSALSLVPRALAQAAPPAAPAPTAPVLSQIVSRLAGAEQRTARDWADMGRETVTWGHRQQSSQQPVAEGPVRDALDAVALGEKLDANLTDWAKLRAELEALLKKPEPPKQDQQKQDEQKQQDQQNSQDQQNNQQNQQPQKQEQQQEKKQPQDSSQQKEQQQGQPEKQEQQQEKQSAFGDMKDRPPPPPQETQKVGGVPEKKPEEQVPPDPAMAVPLQKLDQLRNQDSPAELFKLMDADKGKAPRKTTKDW